jgi:5-(carboxyamino)imidazole ribonucleotide synthase
MMGEAAQGVKVELTVLSTSRDDPAVATSDHFLLGAADDEASLVRLSDVTDVITFDHELVDLELLERLERGGTVFRPSASALHYSVDKAFQREEFAAVGLPVPAFRVLRGDTDLVGLETWSHSLEAAPVLKAARGGYDGRGVLFPARDETMDLAKELLGHGPVVAEERVTLLSEVAQLVVRSLDGEVTSYPLVTTVQVNAMCAEVHYPADIDASLQEHASDLAVRIAHHIGLVGVMAVEYFVTPGGLLINELALRPHNSGHWTIEGAATSQFANHLLAVSGQELGASEATVEAAVMVNVVGAAAPGSLEDARRVEEVFVHDYGKSFRPGRKLGHVTAVGDDARALHVRAWRSARAYGTTTQEAP